MKLAVPLVALLLIGWCASTSELDETNRSARFKGGKPLNICLVSGSFEYDSHASLAMFKTYLEEWYNVRCTLIRAQDVDDLPGLEALDDCDVALFFTRRLSIRGDQLDRVKKYCLSGRPIVALRTASHGFQNWLEFDRLVLGGNYQGHLREGPTMLAAIIKQAKEHLVLDGVTDIKSRHSLYRTAPLADDCELLMTGSTPESGGFQPVTWTREVNGGRVFYTSLGGQQDFENGTFRRLLANALFWTARRELERKEILCQPSLRPKPERTMHLKLRTRAETEKGSGIWHERIVQKEVPIAETAILICDMWDEHRCPHATERLAAMAVRMNEVIKQARAKGVQIVHAPSETMAFYADSPQRIRMMVAPSAPLPDPLEMPPEPALPIDDSDEGCPTGERSYEARTRQHPAIEIGEYDGITENGREVYNLFQQLNVKTMIMMGVYANKCVLGRSFGIRQMTRWGIHCVLVRDLTDSLYNPRKPPFVSHDKGTELVVEHIEKYWCPTVLSSDLMGAVR